MGPDRRRAQANETYANLVGDVLHLTQVSVHLIASLVDCFERGTRQLQRATGFKADIGSVLFQTDQLVAFTYLAPAMAIPQPLQHRHDRAFAFKRQRLKGVFAIAELLVLGPDAPIFLGLATRFQIFGQLFVAFDGTAAGLRDRHETCAPILMCLS